MSLEAGAQWLNFVCFNVGRLWVFSMYFVSVGRLFGFRHYGTPAGAVAAHAMSTRAVEDQSRPTAALGNPTWRAR